MEAVAGLVVAIGQLVIEIAIYLVTFVLSTSFAAAHAKGVARVSYATASLIGVYLLVAFLRGFFVDLALPGLAPFFSWPLIGVALVSAILFTTIPVALNFVERELVSPNPVQRKVDRTEVPFSLIYFFSITIVFAGLAGWSSNIRAPRLADQVCDELDERFGSNLRKLAEKGLDLGARLAKKDLGDKFRCSAPDADGAQSE
ncbi:MAG: hypothetical protein ABI459_09650 [Deltaproteobacteria bacterium]